MGKAAIERTVAAAKRYLGFKDYEVLDELECDGVPVIVADDWGEYVFAYVGYAMDEMPRKAFDRSRFEQMAGAYIKEHDLGDCPVRADSIDMMVVGPDRAFLRHTVNWSNMPDEAA